MKKSRNLPNPAIGFILTLLGTTICHATLLPPVAQADLYVAEADEVFVANASVGVLANDTDPELEPLTAALETPPSHGGVTLDPNGGFTYTPLSGYTGPDSFTYRANDGELNSDVATVSLTVIPKTGGLLANGGFEVGSPAVEGALDAWTALSGDAFGYTANNFPGVANYQPIEGARMAVFNGADNVFNESISQTFPTVVGQTYLIEFELGITGTLGRKQRMGISVVSGGAEFSWQETITSAGTSTSAWVPKIFAFVAASEVTTLTFSDISGGVLPSGNPVNADMLLDHVRVTPGGPRSLTVNSTPSTGLNITVSPLDVNGADNGTTNFIRSYNDGATVTLTAPASDGGANVFQKWLRNGVDFTVNPTAVITIVGNDQTLTAVYGPNSPPVAGNDSYVAEAGSTLVVGATSGVLVNDTDADSDPLTAAPVTGASNGGVTLNSNGGFSYSPNSGYEGPDSFSYLVNDGELNSDPGTVSLTVIPKTGGLLANGSFEVGSPAADGTLDAWTLQSGDPFGYTANAFPGSATYTPSHLGRMAVFNGGNNVFDESISQSFPTIPGQTYVLEFDLGITGTLNRQQKMRISASGAAESPWEETITSAGPGQTKWEPKTYTFVATSSTTTLAFSDISGSPLNSGNADMMLDNVRAHLSGANSPPQFVIASLTGADATEDAAYSGALSATDPDAGDTLTYSLISTPSWLSVAADGTLSGTPANSHVGANAFTVRVTDGAGAYAEATLSITVLNANDAPQFVTASLTGADATEDAAYSGALSATDPDAGDTLTYSLISTPSWLSVAADGTLSGTPANSHVGSNAFTVRVTDGAGAYAEATLSITVNPAPVGNFSDWLTENSLPSDPTIDSDGDTVSNVIEYIIGGDPVNRMDVNLLPGVELVVADPDGDLNASEYVLFTYRRTDRAAQDSSVSIKVEWNDDFSSPWTNAAGTAGVVTKTDDNAAGVGVDLVKVYIPRSLEVDGKLFVRLGAAPASPE